MARCEPLSRPIATISDGGDTLYEAIDETSSARGVPSSSAAVTAARPDGSWLIASRNASSSGPAAASCDPLCRGSPATPRAIPAHRAETPRRSGPLRPAGVYPARVVGSPRIRARRVSGGDSREPPRPMSESRTIFLTGGTGVLGDALLERLAGHRLIALVHETPVDRTDVESVPGDVTEPQLGLDRERYAQLAREVDCVLHASAVTNLVAPLGDICRANVGGTRNVVELARAAEADLFHVSTAFVHADASFVSCDELGADGDAVPAPNEGTEAYINSK